jgi:hypothetical protein
MWRARLRGLGGETRPRGFHRPDHTRLEPETRGVCWRAPPRDMVSPVQTRAAGVGRADRSGQATRPGGRGTAWRTTIERSC